MRIDRFHTNEAQPDHLVPSRIVRFHWWSSFLSDDRQYENARVRWRAETRSLIWFPLEAGAVYNGVTYHLCQSAMAVDCGLLPAAVQSHG
jgi:hypothetical protein